jgi:hypothetical protein
MAGRIQLEASGPQDRFFTLNPDYTHFLESFKKHSNFSIEYVDIDPENAPDFGKKVKFVIPQNTGDLLKTLSVKMKLPAIGSQIGYIESIGHAMIEYVDFSIGGKIVQRLTGDYLQIYSEHYMTQTKQFALEKLIGKYPERAISTRVSDREIVSSLVTESQTDQDFFVDLPLYFYNNPELAVPLCAIKKQEIEVEIKLRDYEYLIVKADGTYEVPATILNIKEFQLCAELVFLDPCERLKIENEKRDYLITQIQQNVFDVAQAVQNATFKLDFVNPVKELYFVIQRQGDIGFGEGEFITPFDYDNTLEERGTSTFSLKT